MKSIFILIIVFLAIILISYYIVNRKRRTTYIKAGEKWEGIIKELSRRK